MKLHALLLVLSAFLLTSVDSLRAGDDPAPATPSFPNEEKWWVHFNSYAWITAQTGDLQIGSISSPVNVSFSDAIDGIDEIDMAFMGGIEAGRGRWSLGVDMTYANISDDFAAGGIAFDSFRLDQTQWMINPFVTYRLSKTERHQFDAILGARINIFEMDITGRFVDGGQITVGGSREWVDPIIGLRGRWDLTDRLAIGFRGDIGGFGVASDLTWQAYVGMGWRMTAGSTLAIGYRGLGTDYAHNGFGTDIVTHGPLLGVQMVF